MKNKQLITSLIALAAALASPALSIAATPKPIVSQDLVFGEKDGLLVIEAEHYFAQDKADLRAWHLTTATQQFKASNDADGAHVQGASGGAYLEILPDTRHHHGHKLISGENFSPTPGKMGILSYKAHFTSPGRYYVWVRAHSTGGEDNGIHVGIDGTWPESGQRMQWCAGKNTWHWESRQRTEKQHCGEPYKIYLDIPEAGEHVISFSMREDGFEFDKFLLTKDRKFSRPEGTGPITLVKSGNVPKPFPVPAAYRDPTPKPAAPKAKGKSKEKAKGKVTAQAAPASVGLTMRAIDFPSEGSNFYVDKGKWLAINPEKNKTARTVAPFPFPSGKYDVTLRVVGENDGQSTYKVLVNDSAIGDFTAPPSAEMYEEGPKFAKTWKNVEMGLGDVTEVQSTVASADGKEYSRARWVALDFEPADAKTRQLTAKLAKAVPTTVGTESKKPAPPLVLPRKPDGKGAIAVTGELKQWHKVTLTLDGPYAHEQDNAPNPFTDYRFEVNFTHESGSPYYDIPGYFAADGDAANSSADSGTKWRAHLSPDKPGKWRYRITLVKGKHAALGNGDFNVVKPFHGEEGEFTVAASDKTGRDLRAKGRLQYVGQRYLRFAGDGSYFLKVGADAPETFLGYKDFDNTIAGKAAKVPLKTWAPHVRDWSKGDPTWKDGKGKGMIGAINYLSGKGCNVFSFLTYNAGGDGDNVWPFTSRDDKLHYDCSKLDQWQIVFDHGTARGMYLHFKMQETEMDDNRAGHKEATGGKVPTSLNGGDLGPERKLYCRELIARFGHELALNWNLGEENTQTTEQQIAMIDTIAALDAYDHNIVVHTFPNEQDKVYNALIGDKSKLTGVSLQNSGIHDTHWQSLKWVTASTKAGKPWIVAFDESGTAAHAQCPDLGYKGYDGRDNDGKMTYTQHEVRKQTLYGNLMAGGAGLEYYFGYKYAENDLICEDWRSRDQSWDYCRIALEFFHGNKVRFWEMENANALIGNPENKNDKFCLAKKGESYVIYLPNGGTTELDLTGVEGNLKVSWFNPRAGGGLKAGSVTQIEGGAIVQLGKAPSDDKEDWLILVRR